jgi:hypothetical protein
MALRVDGNSTQLRSLHNEARATDTNINAEIAQDLYTLQELYYVIFSKLVSYMELYSGGFFDTYVKSLPEETVINITTEIQNVNVNDTTILDDPSLFRIDPTMPAKYKDISEYILNTIKQTLTDRQRISNLQNQNQEFVTFKEILEDGAKLNAYVKEAQRTSYLFTAEATYNQPIQLKLWYQVYLERYGPPGDGVFDTDLLGDIIEELLAADLIQEDDVLV